MERAMLDLLQRETQTAHDRTSHRRRRRHQPVHRVRGEPHVRVDEPQPLPVRLVQEVAGHLVPAIVDAAGAARVPQLNRALPDDPVRLHLIVEVQVPQG
jgi:hypothetical protein